MAISTRDIVVPNWRPDTTEPWAESSAARLAGADATGAVGAFVHRRYSNEAGRHLYEAFLIQMIRDVLVCTDPAREFRPGFSIITAVQAVGTDWALGELSLPRMTGLSVSDFFHRWDSDDCEDPKQVITRVIDGVEEGFVPDLAGFEALCTATTELAYALGWYRSSGELPDLLGRLGVRSGVFALKESRRIAVMVAGLFAASHWFEDARYVLANGFVELREGIYEIEDGPLQAMLRAGSVEAVTRTLGGPGGTRAEARRRGRAIVEGAMRTLRGPRD